MNRVLPSRLLAFGLLAFCLLLSTAIPAKAQDPNEGLLQKLPWRAIGPAIMGGRIDDLAVVESNPKSFYVATAGGGLFKTVNNGTTFDPVFDTQTTSSIGDVTLAPSNPEIVYVGTGEANNRQSSSWGDGVYRSSDGGKTWQKCGLADTMHIGRIVVHPQNPDVLYVAAQGRLWGPNRERGLYKSEDGGKTWAQALFINEDTGVSDVVMDPQNPDTLIAAAYQRRRTAFSFLGSGPHSGLYKTSDGGKTWKKLSEGLPTGDTGRIGLDIYRKNPRIVYATIENASGGIFRSEDGGETWKKMSSTNPRPMYFSQIRIDPNDDQRLWILGVNMAYSTDGGKNVTTGAFRVHADGHALWINPNDSSHLLLGTDGGIQWSYDGGKTWDFLNNLPLAQFYEIAADMQKPYWVYGGLQDNGTWASPVSNTDVRGPSNDEWIQINGGDGFYIQVDPTDHNTLYTESQNGSISRMNKATGERKSIRPTPLPGEPAYRFDWNSPMLLSPHNPKKLYFGGNRLFISTDRGDTWRRTDDLSTNPDRAKMTIMGVVPGKTPMTRYEHNMSTFGQIVTIAESPRQAGLLYVGTDDGNLQVSEDDGKTWKNVALNVPGVPKGTYVSRIVASAYATGRAYAAFDGHRSNDFKPYLFMTEDKGATWSAIAANLPEGGTIHVVREHPRSPDLLFVGTERGLWVSLNRGGRWLRFPEPLPTVPIFDILIHPRDNDLILATHGRGIYVLDDIAFLERAADIARTKNATLFPPRAATALRLTNRKAVTGNRFYGAPNGPNGALIQYHLKAKPTEAEPLTITILEKDGKTVVRELLGQGNARQPRRLASASPEVGLNRLLWDMRQEPPTLPSAPPVTASPTGGTGRPTPAPEAQTQETVSPQPPAGRGGGGGGQGRFGGFGPSGPRVLPGTYLVRLRHGQDEQTYPITVEDDPRIPLNPGQRKARYETLLRLSRMQLSLTAAQRSLRTLRTQLGALPKETPQAIKDAATELDKKALALQSQLTARQDTTPRPGGEERGETEGATSAPPLVPLPTRIQRANFSIEALTEPMTDAQRAEVNALSREVETLLRTLHTLTENGLKALNRTLADSKLTPLPPVERIVLPK